MSKLKTARTLMLILLAMVSAPTSAAAPTQRAIWTWERESYAMVEDATFADDAIGFLRARQVRTVYLYADAFQGRNLVADRPQAYRRLIRRLHRDGFRVYALLGSAYLKTEEYVLPKRRRTALAMFQRILDYNAGAAPEERFDGINLDIEPHLLDQWDTHKHTLLLQFLDLGHALMALKRRSGQTLEVGPAMPFWFDGIELDWRGTRKPVSEHVIDTYDYVALMDYRDHAEGNDGIIDHANAEMAYAKRVRKTVVIGIETTPNEIRKVSFNHLTEADMERELSITARAFGRNPAFAGFALHHFRGYREWLQGQRTRQK